MSDKKIILITGGNTGIGLEAVKALCKEPIAYEILIGSRDRAKGEAAIASLKKEIPNSASTLSTVQVDLESDESITKAFEHVSSNHGKLDVLVIAASQGVSPP